MNLFFLAGGEGKPQSNLTVKPAAILDLVVVPWVFAMAPVYFFI
jgi:hypothetical protein